MTNQLQAFSNSTAIKRRYIAQFKAHVKADDLIRGEYMKRTNSHWRGCAITCILNDRTANPQDVIQSHVKFETEPIQFPEWLGFLIDKLHENTSSIEFSAKWNLRLLKAIPEGFSDFDAIKWQFLSHLLVENIKRVEALQISDELKAQVIAAIQQCKNYVDSDHPAADAVARLVAASAAFAAEASVWSAAYDDYANLLIKLFQNYANKI